VDEIMEKKIVSDKKVLFALTEPTLHYVKVAPDQDEYLKVWIKEPTWLEVDKAMNTLMKIDAKNQDVELDLNAMFRYMVENFVVKTEPQLKEILPNPLEDTQEDEEKND
jgi:hypothetical protein